MYSHESEKNWVGLEVRLCLVCGKRYETGRLLLDKRMRKVYSRYVLTGTGLCPEHEKELKNGNVFLLECETRKADGSHRLTGHSMVIAGAELEKVIPGLGENGIVCMDSETSAKVREKLDKAGVAWRELTSDESLADVLAWKEAS